MRVNMHLDEKCCIKKSCRKDSKKHFCIKDSKYAKELIKLDFPANLYTSPTNCEKLLKHCNKYNMKFLKDSYGTIVHKQFNNYFKESTACGKYQKLRGMVKIGVKTGIHLTILTCLNQRLIQMFIFSLLVLSIH